MLTRRTLVFRWEGVADFCGNKLYPHLLNHPFGDNEKTSEPLSVFAHSLKLKDDIIDR